MQVGERARQVVLEHTLAPETRASNLLQLREQREALERALATFSTSNSQSHATIQDLIRKIKMEGFMGVVPRQEDSCSQEGSERKIAEIAEALLQPCLALRLPAGRKVTVSWE